MKKLIFSAALLAAACLLLLTGCQDEQPGPVQIPVSPQGPTIEAVEPLETAETAAPPPPTLAPTLPPTPAPLPTTQPTPVPSSPTAVTPVSYTIQINTPVTGQSIPVAREFTFAGTIDPLPDEPLEIFLAAAGDETGSLLAYIDPDPATGAWQTTAAVHPRRTGPATFRVRAAESIAGVPVTLTYDPDEEGVFVSLNHPRVADIVVGGRALLLDGESRNPIDGKLQIGVYGCPTAEKSNLLAQLEIAVGNGLWNALVIPPETAGTGCREVRLVVTTGGLEIDDERVTWSADLALPFLRPEDPKAAQIRLGNPFQLTFRPGQATPLYGAAFTAPDGEISLRLVRETPGAEPEILAETLAAVNSFGYWETDLILPAEAVPGEAVLILTYGEGEERVEYRQATSIRP